MLTKTKLLRITAYPSGVWTVDNGTIEAFNHVPGLV